MGGMKTCVRGFGWACRRIGLREGAMMMKKEGHSWHLFSQTANMLVLCGELVKSLEEREPISEQDAAPAGSAGLGASTGPAY